MLAVLCSARSARIPGAMTTYLPGPGGLEDFVQIVLEDLRGGAAETRVFTVVRDEMHSVATVVEELSGEPTRFLHARGSGCEECEEAWESIPERCHAPAVDGGTR